MSERLTMTTAEELRQAALAKVRSGALEEALDLYDAARAVATDDDARELLTINKADALIALDRTGPEVQALPAILMRRRNPRNSFLAAYALLYKHRSSGEIKRAMFYGQIANEIAIEANEPFWKIATLNELGVAYEIDSVFEQAIECFEEAIATIAELENPAEHELSYGLALENLGAAKLQVGRTAEGIDDILRSMPSLQSPVAIAEAHIDLCYGYLDLQQFDVARRHGESGLEMATDERQTRNAHYLLGEACYKSDDIETAEWHFDELARFYPQFRNLKSLLFAIDLRSMLNLKS
jgi:tetratricopeptide (TPR) repeat protein